MSVCNEAYAAGVEWQLGAGQATRRRIGPFSCCVSVSAPPAAAISLSLFRYAPRPHQVPAPPETFFTHTCLLLSPPLPSPLLFLPRFTLKVSSVLLRQNPHNVNEWQKRVKLFAEDPRKAIICYTEVNSESSAPRLRTSSQHGCRHFPATATACFPASASGLAQPPPRPPVLCIFWIGCLASDVPPGSGEETSKRLPYRPPHRL